MNIDERITEIVADHDNYHAYPDGFKPEAIKELMRDLLAEVVPKRRAIMHLNDDQIDESWPCKLHGKEMDECKGVNIAISHVEAKQRELGL